MLVLYLWLGINPAWFGHATCGSGTGRAFGALSRISIGLGIVVGYGRVLLADAMVNGRVPLLLRKQVYLQYKYDSIVSLALLCRYITKHPPSELSNT
ncbi:hypothetical protein K458DRAFT_32990 [Lentithecium fluviatile CBS 122367]|uniref:Uncharacterized protein n=1 Tax=Lentithecium fluviatile CBS 122367 TaxID=1168545 RepID=A0A6G1J2Q8_9PLEO|nr:hypothetical protein K458DRAFT_32990 [Lentithecium fluviatile CBS 122367]